MNTVRAIFCCYGCRWVDGSIQQASNDEICWDSCLTIIKRSIFLDGGRNWGADRPPPHDSHNSSGRCRAFNGHVAHSLVRQFALEGKNWKIWRIGLDFVYFISLFQQHDLFVSIFGSKQVILFFYFNLARNDPSTEINTPVVPHPATFFRMHLCDQNFGVRMTDRPAKRHPTYPVQEPVL